jgi:hypothetical protein
MNEHLYKVCYRCRSKENREEVSCWQIGAKPRPIAVRVGDCYEQLSVDTIIAGNG